jgi:ribonuclease R
MAAESSAHERRAMEAEREVVDMYRAFLMRDRIGEEYDGSVVGVTGFGIFVQIESPFVEGLVRGELLPGAPFQLDEQGMRLVSPKTGRAFALGDTVHVRIENVSVPRRQIDMALVGEVAAAQREPRAPRQRTPRHRQGKQRTRR